MASSSLLVIGNRVHAHPLLSVLPPEKLRGTRYATSQELLFLALGDRNRACALRGVARSCTKWRGPRGRLHDRSPCCAPLRTVEPHTTTLMQLSRARCGIVRHQRCPNPRLPRSTPSAYSQREVTPDVSPLGPHQSTCIAADAFENTRYSAATCGRRLSACRSTRPHVCALRI